MKYKVTLNGKTYEVEVDKGEAILVDEYAAHAPAPGAPVAVPVATAASVASAPVAAPASVVAPAAAPAAPTQADGEVIASPMPGTILSIKVSPGQTVKKGQVLLILEAMKMENEIVAPIDGTIGAIPVSQGATVDTGAPLIIFGNPIAVSAAPTPAPAPVATPAPAPVVAQAAAPVPAPSPVEASTAPVDGEVIVAPMPGTILSIKVSQSQSIKKGQVILILEAMKMENEIVAPRDGVIAQINTTQGASVDTGAPLVVLG